VQPNNDGAVGMTPTYTLSSPLGIFNENNWYRFYAYRSGGSGPYLLFVQWKKNGVESGVDVTGSLVINGAVYLRLRCDNTHIHFEASLDGVNWTDKYSEIFGLPEYTLDSSFYYELAAYNTPPNGVMTIDDFSIVSTSSTPDTQPPVISGVAAQNITATGAQIIWQTDKAADSQVEYGLTTAYGSTTTLAPALITTHTAALTGLQSNKTYHYRVKSHDAAGNRATSNDFTLTTASTGDVTPPVISNVAANNPTAATATINWSTNEISDSQVEYGLTTNYGASTPLSTALVAAHTVTLAGLQANTIYHYRVKSRDAADNLATSGDFTFTTGNLPGAGPGLPNLSYPANEVFTIISRIDSTKGAPRSHGSVSMHKGFLAVIYSADGIYSDGGFSFYNISNPYAPVLMHRKDDAETDQLREAHGYGFSSSYPGDYVALQAAYGVQIWDWTNITNPIRLSYLQLPGIQDSDYALGAWWLCWQAPYIYVGGSSNGIYIVDATDAANPVLVNRGAGKPNPIPISQTGGFRLGPIFAIGNLLVASSMEGEGYLTMDISDPKNPVVLATQNLGMPNIYSTMVNGNKILSAGNGASGTTDTGYLHVHNISDPSRIDLLNEIFMGGRRGYITFQDGFVHMGGGQQYTKIDIRNDAAYSIVGTATSNIVNRSEDFATPLGNLVMVSDDHGNGSFIIPHQAAPDYTGPQVNMVSPPNNAVNQAFTTRAGLTFTDMIDLRSVNNSTFIVRASTGSAAPLNGKYSTQTGIVNFFPSAPLQENTVYEIVVPQGGIKDWSGNPTATTFISRFTTTSYNNVPLECELLPHAPALVDENVTFATRITRIVGTPKYSYDFGDGTPATPFVADSLANHVYAQPGHYTVRVAVMDSLATSHCSGAQTIHYSVSAVLPTASSPIILDNAQNLVWNVNPDHGTVTAIDAIALTKRFERTVGKEPRTLAQAPDGRIWVVNQADATISVLERSTGNWVSTIALPYASRPFGLAFSPDGAAGYVTLQATGRLLKINPATRSIIGDLEIGPAPKGIAISGNSARILVTRFISPSDHGEVTEIDAAGFSVVRRYDLALDPGPDTEGSGRGVPNYISAITISPDGRRAWAPSKKDNTGRGQLRDGLPLTFENTVRTIVSQIDLVNNNEDLAARLDLNNRDLAVAAQFSGLGDYTFVATQGSNSIEVFEAYHRNLVTSIENVGRAPQGMILSGDGTKLFVHCFMSRSVAVYEVSGIIAGSNNSAPKLAEITTVSSETLPPLVFAGKQIFFNAKDSRMNLDGYISCASCHLDGDDDGRVWDFTDRGEGLRNTISLLGRRGTGQGRVHWSANFDEIQDFEHDIRNAFGGSGFMSSAAFNTGTRNQPLGDPKAGISAELDALAAYVGSLTEVPPSPYRNAGGFLTADGQAGQALFQQLNCAACHGGNDFTDSGTGQMHDVGTIKSSSGKRLNETLLGLDTPTLRGLWQTPPYLHDGSAATLLDVLTTANPNGVHGSTPSLSAVQKQQLAAYLLQIDNLEPPAPAAAPVVVIASPLPNASFAPAQQIVINVDAVSSLGSIDKIEFYAGAAKLGEDASSPYSFVWTGAALGAHILTARAIYSNGIKTLSAPVAIKVVSFLDVTLQAEDMPIKTNGDPRPPGWVLWENGYLAQTVNFSSSGLYQFTLRALGVLAAGEWSQAELRLDQVPQAVINVSAPVYTDFAVEFNISAGTHEVAIAFINDLYNPPDNRNLYVDWLRIQSSSSGPTDTQPPIISNVAANNLTTSAATIVWTTNEASDSQVEYGLTTSYGASTSLSTAPLTSHSVPLSGLQANTIYHYRVKSRDAAGNLAMSGDFAFTTGSVSQLTVRSPNGGEWWIAGANQQITWSGPGTIANVKLEFSRDAGAVWRTIVASTPNTGAYSWPAPDTVSNTCLIRVSDAANASVADVSNQTFFITRSALVNFAPSPGAPVLSPGAAGSWDENIRERGWFMYDNGAYHAWYGGWQGQYNRSIPQLVKLGYAYSADGVNWTKYAANPIHSQHWTEDIVVVKDGNTYYLYAEDEHTGDGDGAFIDLYTSTDRINWTRYGTVLSPSGNGWEESDVGTPTVWKEGNTWYMLYEGLRSGIAGKVGLATSSDGKNWTRHAGNPVLST